MNRGVVIVPAAAEHIPEMLELLRRLDSPDFSYAVADEIDAAVRQGKYFVALAAEAVVGVIGLVITEQACEILTLVSKQPGVGRALADFARAWAVAQGAKKLWCWSLARYNARGFYESTGFTESFLARRQWFGEDCYYFGMPLAPAATGGA